LIEKQEQFKGALHLRVLVLGGTGSIGRGVVAALLRRNHEAVALARSRDSADRLARAGATPLRGDLHDIDGWISAVKQVDCIIHAAATWGDDMTTTDRRVVETLLPAMASCDPPKAFVYTGGTWKYGHTGDSIATEESPSIDIEYFADSVNTEKMVIAAPRVRGMVIHPAMVYEDHGGVFKHMYNDAKTLGYIRVIGGKHIRWPLVHHDDLGELYVLMLERGRPGNVFNGSAIKGCPIGQIARAIAQRLNVPSEPKVMSISDAVREFGPWAEGYAIDHQVSGRKAMETLGWHPKHCDVISDVATL
jgi:nucleoside-diphosphate-sugar epimerase